MTTASSASDSTLTTLRIAAVLTAVLSIVQPLLAVGPLTNSGALNPLHSTVAYLATLASVIAAVAAWLWGKRSGNKGLVGHAISVPVLAIVQIGLGEMHLDVVHMALGFAFLLAAVSLATLAFRKPAGATRA